MLTKAILSLILAPVILIGEIFNLQKPEIYVAPKTENPPLIEKISTTTPIVKNEQETQSTTTTKKEVKKEAVKIVENKTPSTPIVNEPPVNFELINENSRKTIVNIFCTTKYGDLSPISGTGVIVNGNGLVLTNAHIGQYLLIKDFREKDYINCVARTGSPAYPKYKLELVYISENWVYENKSILKEQTPKGTGENDYAFLRITGPISGNDFPNGFYYIEPNVRELISIGEPVLLASYPAGFLGGLSIIQNLHITSSVTNIQDIFTFKDGTIDVIAVGGTVVSQKGSSGGLVVDKNTSLIGIITTSSDGVTTSSRGLNAITVAYINRNLQREISMGMRQFLSLDHEQFARSFASTTAPKLSKLIIDELTVR